MTQKD